MGNYVSKKKNMKFQSVEALQEVVNIMNETAVSIHDDKRTIRKTPFPEVAGGAIGGILGGASSLGLLSLLGRPGLSAAGIMSGLSTAGSLVSKLSQGNLSPSVCGIFVLALPIGVLAAAGVGLAARWKNKLLRKEKERLYEEALETQKRLIKSLENQMDTSIERMDKLQEMNILLKHSIEELQTDLGIAPEPAVMQAG